MGGASPNSELERFVYEGQSMRPFFKDADVLYAIPCKAQEVRRGDVIVYRSGENALKMVHRVVRIRDGNIWTKADACLLADLPALGEDDIVAKVLFLKRGARKVRVYNGKAGFFISACLQCAMLLKKWARRALARPCVKKYSL